MSKTDYYYYRIGTITKVIDESPHVKDGYYKRAKIKYKLQDYKGCEEDLKRALKICPSYPKAYILLAKVKIAIEDHRSALPLLNKVIKLESKNIKAYKLRALVKSHCFISKNDRGVIREILDTEGCEKDNITVQKLEATKKVKI